MDTAIMTLTDLVQQIGVLLIPVLVPMIIGAWKMFVTNRIPGAYLPIVAAILGPSLDYGIAFSTNTESHGMLAVLLGLAGVGLREIKEGGAKVIAGTATVVKKDDPKP